MRTALAFSGGRDSWACLWLNADRLHEIAVIWVNPGKGLPEQLASIERARAMCRHFYEVKTDRDAQNALYGLPADVVPVNWTALGQMVSGPKPVMVQSYLDCCLENIMRPIHAKALELGVQEVICGQRNDEAMKSPAQDGQIVDGLVRRFPLAAWSKADVMAYLEARMEVPEHFYFDHSSLDCFDCTAYTRHSRDKHEYMRRRHPNLYAIYAAKAAALTKALNEACA